MKVFTTHSFCWATFLGVLVQSQDVHSQGHQGEKAWVTEEVYSEVCGTDPNQVSYFPGSPSSVRRRLWLPEEATASQRTFVQAQQREEREETSFRDLQEGTNGNEIPLYRCTCGSIEQEDEMNNSQNVSIYSYCPLDFTCVFFQAEGVAPQCMVIPFMNAINNMAWPVFLITALCFVIVFTMSLYGVAFPKYIRKHYGMGRSRRTPEELEEEESREVDELMAVSRIDPPPPRPWRCRIFRYQLWHYQTTVLTKAREGWTREWNRYRRQQIRQRQNDLRFGETIQTKMYLKTKIYGEDDAVSVDKSASLTATNTGDGEDDEVELQVRVRAGETKSIGATGTTNSTQVSTPKMTCSICFAEIQAGERVGDLDCRHDFHSGCLKTWIQTGIRNNCPLCQAPDIARPVPS